jgi:hypothetical protein
LASEKVNLDPDDVKKHRNQVNGLRDRLAQKIKDDPDYGLVKSLHAGSVAKRTALSSVDDLDLAVYVRAESAPEGDPALVSWLAERLYEATTNMTRDQFEENDQCVTVHYKGSGLDVDVVPVLYEGEENDIGYLIKKHSGDRLKTSVRLHLDFLATRRKTHGPQFLELIRVTKWWKRQVINHRDQGFKFKSFMIELIWAHLADNGVPLSDYPRAMEHFFEYLLCTGLEEQVKFTDYTSLNDIPKRGAGAIEIIDPVNPENNVAVRYDVTGRDRILEKAQDAYDAITDARYATTKGRAVDDWREILGLTFRG